MVVVVAPGQYERLRRPMTSDDLRACARRRSASLSRRSRNFNLVSLPAVLGPAPLAVCASIIYGLSHAKRLVKTTNTHCIRFHWRFTLKRKTCIVERAAQVVRPVQRIASKLSKDALSSRRLLSIRLPPVCRPHRSLHPFPLEWMLQCLDRYTACRTPPRPHR